MRARNAAPPMVLLTRESRGGAVKLGLLGGKKDAADGGDPRRTAAREAWEETNERLSDATRRSIAEPWAVSAEPSAPPSE